ncbi:MAG: hypothetical protein AAF065_08275 [Verrucomicrobiota bacterium]
MNIIAYRNDDLGGRILNAYASYLIANLCGGKLEFFWDANLIERSGKLSVQLEKNPYKRRYAQEMKRCFPRLKFIGETQMNAVLDADHYVFVRNLQDLLEHKESGKTLILTGQLELLGEERDVESLRLNDFFGEEAPEMYEFLFNETGLSEELVEKVDKLASDLKLSHSVGMHVRRGDCMLMKEMLLTGKRYGGFSDEEIERGARKAIRYEDYTNAFHRFGPLNLFICSDSDDVKYVFESHYGQRYHSYDVRSYYRLNLFGVSKWQKVIRLLKFRGIRHGIEDAIIDMLLLAHCRYIVRGSSLLGKVSTMLNNDFIEIEDNGVLVDNVWGTENLRFKSRTANRIPFSADLHQAPSSIAYPESTQRLSNM